MPATICNIFSCVFNTATLTSRKCRNCRSKRHPFSRKSEDTSRIPRGPWCFSRNVPWWRPKAEPAGQRNRRRPNVPRWKSYSGWGPGHPAERRHCKRRKTSSFLPSRPASFQFLRNSKPCCGFAVRSAVFDGVLSCLLGKGVSRSLAPFSASLLRLISECTRAVFWHILNLVLWLWLPFEKVKHWVIRVEKYGSVFF